MGAEQSRALSQTTTPCLLQAAVQQEVQGNLLYVLRSSRETATYQDYLSNDSQQGDHLMDG